MNGKPVYLDYQASTPVDPLVREAMMPFLTEQFGNPHSSDHSFGWEASSAVRTARAQVASLINADDDEIVFTSGATESCNLALRGIATRAGNGARVRMVTLATEHPAVLETVLDLGQSGHETVVLPVGSDGLVDLADLDRVLDEKALIVSVMAANNEIGVLQTHPRDRRALSQPWGHSFTPTRRKRRPDSLSRLRQLGPLTDDNLLIFRDRTPKGRHYTERPGAPRRGFKTAASARAASAMPSRADAGVVRGPRSAGYGAPAPSGARRRSAHGGRPSGWRRTSRRWREG